MSGYTEHSGVRREADGTLYGICPCDRTGASRPLVAVGDARPVCYACAGQAEPTPPSAPAFVDTYTRDLQGAREAARLALGWDSSRRFSY